MKKVKYAVDKVSLIEDYSDSTISVLDVYVSSSGDNAHGIPIEKEAIINAKNTLNRKPVLANYIPWKEDFGGHEPEEIPVGVFLNDSEDAFRIVEDKEENKLWTVARAYIWKQYAPYVIDVFKKKGDKTDVSMEIDILEEGVDEYGNETIKSFSYAGVTLLGVEPAIAGAHATVMKYSKDDNMFKDIEKVVYGKKMYSIPKEVKENVEMAVELKNKLNRKTDSTFLFMTDALTSHDKIEFEHIEKINEYLNKNIEDENARGNSNKYIFFNGYGGKAALEWSGDIINNFSQKSDEKMEENSHRKEQVMKKEDVKNEEFEKETDKMENPMEDEMAKDKMEDESMEEMGENKMEDKMADDEMEKDCMEESMGKESMEDPMEEEDEDMEEDGDPVYMQEKEMMSAKILELENEVDALKAKNEKYQKDIEELTKYKSEIESKEFQEGVDKALSGAKDVIADEEFKALKEKSENYNLQTLSDYENLVKATCFDAMVEKQKKKEEKFEKFDITSLWNKDEEDNDNKTKTWNDIPE